MASKYPSLSGYSYVGGNPVRFVDIDGKDSTVYIHFDPNSKHFNGEDGRENRKKLISSMQAIFDANGVPVHIVVTSFTPDDVTNNPFLLDITDQYLFFSAGTVSFDPQEKGFTSGINRNISNINLLQGSFGGDAVFKSSGPDISSIANTAAHEAIHGYLRRARNYFGETNERMGLNEEEHHNKTRNLMQDGGIKRLLPNRTSITSKNIVSEDKLIELHQRYVKYFIQENVRQNGCYPLLK